MRCHQKWLTVGASTLIAGTIASVIFPFAKSVAVIAASTVGSVGGIILTSSRRWPSSNVEGAVPNEQLVHAIASLTKLLEHNTSELAAFKRQVHQISSSKVELKRAAIFYDIENLLKGYSFSQEILANLSLKEILSAIRQTGRIEQIAIQQAYANWSDPRLKFMRGEINELGIEPIQVFGFSREPTKNAADIQLVIDAVDLAYVRSSIEVFVIVSGDGGFVSLAKKLHEYGKIVIGCAYQNSASKTFQAVCDDFVWIADPEEERHYQKDIPSNSKHSTEADPQNTRLNNLTKSLKPSLSSHQPSSKPADGLDPRNVRLTHQISRRKPSLPEDTVAMTREILHWYATDKICRSDLSKYGIYLSVIQQAVSYIILGFEPINLGFAKFIEYMQFVCKDSKLCIARLPTSQVILTLREENPDGAEILPDLDGREIHSVDTYLSILAAGKPSYQLPLPEELYAIANWIVEHPIHKVDLGTAIEDIVNGLNAEIASQVVRRALFCLISAEIFIQEPEGMHISEQKLSLREDICSSQAILHTLKNAVIQKLAAALPYVDDNVLTQILPDAA